MSDSNDLLSPKLLHGYQKKAILHSLYHDKSMLWLDPGLGKSIVTLSSIVHRMNCNQVKKTLVVAPIRVLYSVWNNIESNKWSHTNHLKASIIHGNKNERIKALSKNADIYGVNYEGLIWLVEILFNEYVKRGLPLPFDMIVYDEITKMKNSRSIRFNGDTKEVVDNFNKVVLLRTKGWKEISHLFKYRIGLTGTPSSNGMIDLFGQYLAIDDGERLGEYITHYRDNYFKSDYMGYSYEVTELGERVIREKISDITMSMSAKDYLELPQVTYNVIKTELPNKARKHYNEIEKQLFTELDSGIQVELFSASSVSNKCLQISNGAMYTHSHSEGETPKWEKLHEVKLDALEDIVEEMAGKPILVSYMFKTDAELIMKRFKKYKPVNLTGEKASKTDKIIKDFTEGKIKILLGHPASCGHGIDGLQKACSTIVWYGINWSLELYLQLNCRIDRQGQNKPVIIHHIINKDTIDEVVLEAIENKNTNQDNLKKAIKKYRDKK